MRIKACREISNPLPDFVDKPFVEGMWLEIDDEEIIKIGKRYFELTNGDTEFTKKLETWRKNNWEYNPFREEMIRNRQDLELLKEKMLQLIEVMQEIRPKGKWINEYPHADGTGGYKCSICGEYFCFISVMNKNYCTNCGAHMINGGDKND